MSPCSSLVSPANPSNPVILPSVAVAGSFSGCSSFQHPWDALSAPQAYWPPQVPRGPGRACIGYPNHYMMECCQGRRDYICGWEVCIGTMSDGAIESCFDRIANRDGRRNLEDEDVDDMWDGEQANNTRRGRRYSFTCASAGSRSASPSASSKSGARRALVGAVVFAVAAAVFSTGI